MSLPLLEGTYKHSVPQKSKFPLLGSKDSRVPVQLILGGILNLVQFDWLKPFVMQFSVQNEDDENDDEEEDLEDMPMFVTAYKLFV